jgi:hypothetical protein
MAHFASAIGFPACTGNSMSLSMVIPNRKIVFLSSPAMLSSMSTAPFFGGKASFYAVYSPQIAAYNV